ncbi:MAG: HAMP domain protein [Syntrophorhabdaceae bacterium PtaU1.Bin034]|nr:MAG: HAMP domain protein [Syntrophorhabdaceae bacterium PtaU1.Bin034]
MKKSQLSLSVGLSVLGPSSITLGFLIIFGGISFFWLMGEKAAFDIAVAVSMLVAMVIISGVSMFFGTRAIRTKINKIVEVLDDVSKGNLGCRMNVDSQDEFGKMGKSFNAFMDAL